MVDEKALYIAVGREIKEIRKKTNLTQAEFAKRVGLERTSITNIEAGNQKITLWALYQVCSAFNLNYEQLLPAPKKETKTFQYQDQEVSSEVFNVLKGL